MKYLKILSDNTPPEHLKQSYTPYLLSFIAALIFPFPWIYCSEQNISISQNAIVRGVSAIGLHYMTCRLTQSPLDLKCGNSLKLLIIRSFIMGIYSLVMSLAQFILPLPAVHTINCSGQILVFIIDYFMNGVKINCQQAIGVFVGIVGVLLAGNGRVIMQLADGQYVEKTDFKHYITDDIRIIAVFTIIFIITMIFWAYAAVLTKQIKANAFQIAIFLGFFTNLTGSLSYPYTTNTSTFKTLFLAIFFTGIPLIMGQTLYIAGLRMSKNAGAVSIMGFASIVMSYFISIFRYNQKPNIVISVGVVLVLFGLWRTIFGKSRN